jgi:hypothetical protein
MAAYLHGKAGQLRQGRDSMQLGGSRDADHVQDIKI